MGNLCSAPDADNSAPVEITFRSRLQGGGDKPLKKASELELMLIEVIRTLEQRENRPVYQIEI